MVGAVDALERLRQLAEKVDAFFERVHFAHGDAMKCGSGCATCCSTRFSVTLVEAANIAAGLEHMSEEKLRRLRDRAISGDKTKCGALDDLGRCEIYEVRPLICRSHGAPIRHVAEHEGHKLPIVECCPLNFDEGAALDGVPEADIFDQTTMSTILGAVDAAFSAEVDVPAGTRIELADILVAPDEIPHEPDS
jgi:Fe-S-cluster containining protein